MSGGLVVVVLVVLVFAVTVLARTKRYGCMASLGALALFLAILAISPLSPWKSTSYATLLPFPVPHEHTVKYQEALANYMLAPRGFDEAYAHIAETKGVLATPIKEYLENSEAMLDALDKVIVVDPAEAKEGYEERPVPIRDMIHGGANPTRLDAAALLYRCRCWARILERDRRAAVTDALRLMRLGHDALHSAHPSHPQLAWKQGLGFVMLGCRCLAELISNGPPLREELRRHVRFHLRAYAALVPDYAGVHRAASERNYRRLSEGLYFPPESIDFKHPKTNWTLVSELAEKTNQHPAQTLFELFMNRSSAANELRNVYLDWAPVFDATSYEEGRKKADEAKGREGSLRYAATRLNLVDFKGLYETMLRYRAWMAAVEATLLLDEHRAANDGRLPNRLDGLKSKDPAATKPVDPFTDAAFNYRPGQGGYLLYGPGPDRKDDGGSPERDLVFVGGPSSR